MKAFILTLLGLGFTALFALFCFDYVKDWSIKPSFVGDGFVYELKPGTGLDSLSEDLSQNNVVSSKLLFKYWVKYLADYSKFQAGKYRFSDKISPLEVVASFVSGSTYNPVVLEFTIPEGFTYEQIARKLSSFKLGNFEDLSKLKNDKNFIKELGLKSETLEGYVYPATYSFIEKPDAKKVIRRAVEEFKKRLPEDYELSLIHI